MVDVLVLPDQSDALMREHNVQCNFICHLRVSGLVICNELVGQEAETSFEGQTAHIQFPGEGEDFKVEGVDPVIGWYGDPVEALQVQVVRVRFPLGLDDEERSDNARLGQRILEMEGMARRLLVAFLDQVRVMVGQDWLTMSGETPALVGTPAIYDDRGDLLRRQVTLESLAPSGFRVVSYLDADFCAVALGRVQKGAPAPVAEVLLADAAYLVHDPRRNHGSLALVLAAMAAEIKIKRTLLDVVHDEGRELLEILINSPRDASLAASSLWTKAAEAVTGRSLRNENGELWKKIEALFKQRNRVAHRGETFTREEAHEAVTAARAAFSWINEVARDLGHREYRTWPTRDYPPPT